MKWASATIWFGIAVHTLTGNAHAQDKVNLERITSILRSRCIQHEQQAITALESRVPTRDEMARWTEHCKNKAQLDAKVFASSSAADRIQMLRDACTGAHPLFFALVKMGNPTPETRRVVAVNIYEACTKDVNAEYEQAMSR
ncbi:hypothetical protein [Ferrovibrio sp.]|uniref:hypothetical protein n=1 Tax=Ferrovibrio sp. TaxID=1917215 RepID=UPI001B4F6832|nr:hypothetical protein [Ferrovibrio sp.]MBP7065501.1 hypothetical protein [Ferrovibrio sp.]